MAEGGARIHEARTSSGRHRLADLYSKPTSTRSETIERELYLRPRQGPRVRTFEILTAVF